MVRFKNRYLLVELSFSSSSEATQALQTLSYKGLQTILKEAVLGLHGDYGLACVQRSLTVKYINVTTRVALIRCPRDYHRAVWAAISMISNVHKVPCAINVLHLGGTIRSCQKFLVRHNQRKLREMIKATHNPVERRSLEAKVEEILRKDATPLRV